MDAKLPPGVTLAIANSRDHRDIAAIREVYNGLDYLDFMYPYYMSNPDIYCYILYLHKIPMAFVIRFVVDDGNTVVSGAGRTHPHITGKGYMKILLEYADRHVQSKLQKPANKLVYTALYTDNLQAMVNKPNSGLKIMLTRQMYSGKTTKIAISSLLQKSPSKISDDLWRPDMDQFLRLVMDTSTSKKLFPDDHFIVFWEPFHLLASNLEHVYHTSDVYLSSDDKRMSCDAVSAITMIPCKNGMRVDFDFFGTSNQRLIEHLNNCLHVLNNSGMRDDIIVELVVYYPQEINKSDVKQSMSKWGLLTGSYKAYEKSVLIHMESPVFAAKI